MNELRRILNGPGGLSACRDHPEAMVKFVMSLRLMPEQDYGIQEYRAQFYSESKFGLRTVARTDFRHFSAFCGPFWGLLRYDQQAGLRLVLDLVNHAVDMYVSQREDPIRQITISVPGRGRVKQRANDRLWLAYRGASDVPHLLMCALMALERWLLDMCEGRHPVERLLLYILGASNNVMTTGVVASVCTAHPDLCGGATAALLGSQHCIELDVLRRKKEGHRPTLRYVATGRQDKHFDEERKMSDALPHRQHDLEWLKLRLRDGTPPDGEGQAMSSDKTGARIHDRGVPQAEDPRVGASGSLYDWGLKRWRRDSNESNTESWRQALAHTEPHAESDRVHFTNNGLPVVAAVCVRDHWEEMSVGERHLCADTLIVEVGRYSDKWDYAASVLASPVDSDSIAARSLPRILADDPGNRKILGAVARSLTHASPAVRLNTAKGVGEYLEPKHRDMLLQCAGAIAMLSNLLTGNGRHRSQKGSMSVPDQSGIKRNAPEPARRALADLSVDTKTELENLDLASRRGRDAAVSIMHVLGRAPDLPVTKPFIAKLGRDVADTWTEEHELIGDPDRTFGNNVMAGLAEIMLSLPDTMLDYCKPFLDMVDTRPDRVASFVKSLVIRVDESSGSRFWDVWQAFADQIIAAPWTSDTVSDDSKGAELMRCMVFDMEWLKGSSHWAHMACHEERVCKFVGQLPPTPHLMTSFVHYLYISGAGSNTAPLTAVAGCLRGGDPELLNNEDTIRCLSYVLQRYVYGRTATLKKNPALRKDTLLILERLVDAGSSAAYRMRNDFATPNVGK